MASPEDLLRVDHAQGTGHTTVHESRGKPLRRVLAACTLVLGVGVAAATLAAPGHLRGEEPSVAGPRRLASRSDLPSFDFDPLSESAQGMPGMPLGFDGNPSASGSGSSSSTGSVADGEQCCSFEELYAGMCYKKCSLLTNGTHPNRVSPTSCCKSSSVYCMLPSNVRMSGFLPGTGFNVNDEGGAPHAPGICDGNEEMFAGQCHKKCAVLTNNEYPIRSGGSTCCKKMPCLWGIATVGTAPCTGYNVGGGLVAAHKCPHPPTLPR